MAEPSRKILIALDDSAGSKYAFEWTLDNIIDSSTDLFYLVAVMPPVVAYTGATGRPGYHLKEDYRVEEVHKRKADGLKMLEKYQARCQERKVVTKPCVQVGDARLLLPEIAEKLGVDMVVVGSRGHGAIKRLLLGSVSEYCAHSCPMPVIIVRPEMGPPPAE